MATNKLPPFANGTGANVLDYSAWVSLPDQQTGFESGIARSIRCNFPWAEGAAAAHALGELVVANTTADATIDASALATNLSASVVQTKVAQTITGAKTFSGAVTVTGAFKSNNFAPRSNNTYNLGAASAVWKNVYATTFTGDLSGTASNATADADGNQISTTYAKVASANAFSGQNTFSGRTILDGRTDFSALYIKDGDYAYSALSHVLSPSSYGINLALSSGGSVFVTSGESKFYITEENGFSSTSEHVQLIADSQIYFRTDQNSGFDANRGAVMSYLRFRPLTDNTMDLGASSSRWASVYASSFVGDLTGTASQAVADGNGNTIASTYLPLSGGTITGQIKSSIKNVIAQTTDNSDSAFLGGSSAETGAYLRLDGQSGNYSGGFRLVANDSSGQTRISSVLYGTPGGSLTWGGNELATQSWVQGLGYAVDSAVVHLAGAEKITGSKTFSVDVNRSYNTFVKGTTPANNGYVGYRMVDKDGEPLGGAQHRILATGTSQTRLYAYKNEAGSDSFAAIGVAYPATGSSYGYAPSTPSGSTGTEIATADFVVGLDSAIDANAVHKTGNESISGTKTFSDVIVIDQTATTPSEGGFVGAFQLKYKTTGGTEITAYPIQYVGGTSTANITLAFGSSNGATIVGAGEGGKRIPATASGATNSESLYLAADSSIFTYAGCANDGTGGTLVSSQSASGATFSVPLSAPTATAGTASTQVATTAFVANGFLPLSGGAITGAITSAIENTISAARATGNVWVAKAMRTDTGQGVSFGVGTAGQNRGIYDIAASKWGFFLGSDNLASTQAGVTDTADDSANHLATTGWTKDVLADYALTSALSSYLPLAGGTMTGAVKRSGIFVQNTGQTSYTEWLGGSSSSNGAWMALYGGSHGTYGGSLRARFNDGTNSRYMTIKPDGTFQWGTENVATQEWVKVASKGSRTTDGNWSITGLEVGRPLFILHQKSGTVGVCNLAATSGVSNGGINSSGNIYDLGKSGTDVAVFVPSAATVVLSCSGLADDGDKLYAYQ